MCTAHTAPAEARAPDPGQVSAAVPPRRPNFAVCLIALLILLLVASLIAARARRSSPRSPARSAIPLSEAVARACRTIGLAPDASQLAQLTRAVAAVFNQATNSNHGCTRIHTDGCDS